MTFMTDENGDYILDENGNKIEYIVETFQIDRLKPKEPIHLNNDGHLDTEDRHFGDKGWCQQ